MTNRDEQVQALIRSALLEDIGNGDHSTLSCIPFDTRGKAVLKIKADGVLAGMEMAERIFKSVEPGILFTPLKQDGEHMQPGENAFEVQGRIHTILSCERLALNTMQRMSGIATLTRQYADALKGYHTTILDTRKTTPNFRIFEKEAVRIGGGGNHRMGLYDMIMLKDNHIDYAGGITAALQRAADYVQRYHPQLKIEVETRNLDEVKQVLACGLAHRIMLDNFTPAEISEALSLINGRFETEASGGINLDNIEAYAKTGVDYISAGALIHQARSLDLSLKAVPE